MKRNYIQELTNIGLINDTTLSMDAEIESCYIEIEDKENTIATLEMRVLRLEEGLKEIRNSVLDQSPNWIAGRANNILKSK